MASRGLWHFMGARTRRSLALSWSALFVLSLLLQYFSFALASPALAVHDEGLFELDGNATGQAAPGDDWDQVKAGTSSAGQTEFITDAINSTPAEHLFQGGGSKDGQPISAWKWTTGAGVQDKNDIEHAFAAAYTVATGDKAGHQIVYFGQDRFAQAGDAFVGFWFFKSAVGEGASGSFTGAHQVGDVLVQVNFTNGGAIQDFDISKWNGSGLTSVATGVECTAALTNDDACGKVNGDGIGEIDSPWAYTPKAGTANKIPEGGFFEAGLDLTNLGLDSGCFSTFLAETRSSQSLTSTLSDYALGSFSFCVGADIETQVKQGGQSTGSLGHITIGDSVTDTVTITGSKGTATGTVEFFTCFDANSVPDCSTGGTSRGTKTLSGGTATSDPFTPANIATYCFRVEYTPAAGSHYLPGSHTNSTTECFVVDKRPTSITTSANQTVSLGASISDSAVLSGASDDAGGTIVFKAYGPADGNCNGTPAFTSAPVAVSGNGPYGPVSFTPDSAGTYHWIATYSGDAKNLGSHGDCGETGENDTVGKLHPTVITVASAPVVVGVQIHDTATLSGAHEPTSGSITFNLYGPNDADCSGSVAFTSTVPVTANGDYASGNFTTTKAGTYRWIANYSGDANNTATANGCNEDNESVVVSKTTPSIATSLVAGNTTGANISVPLGTSVHDTSTLTGVTATAGGTVHYQVFTNAGCTTLFSDAGTVPVVNGVPVNSMTLTFNQAGIYYWQADYSGDSDNGPASSDCSKETVSVGLNSPTISTTASASVLVGGQIHDTATLAGGFNPTGTITFRLYGPNDATCATTAIFTSTVNVNGNDDYVSSAFTTTAAGTYRWVATYSGDANNAVASGSCNDANENVIVTSPNLDVIKLVATGDGPFGPTSIATPGDVLNYRITVTNSGNGVATDVPVSDNIAPLLVHATYNDDCNLSCNLVGSTLNWTIPSIAPNGGSATLTFSVTLSDTFPTGTTHLPNVVIVTGPGSNCAAESQDPDCATDTTVATSVLTIDKDVSGNTGGVFNDPTDPTNPLNGLKQAKIGDILTYTLHYSGAGMLTHVVVTDPIPAGLDYVAGSATGDANFDAGVYDAGTRTITWNQPDPTVSLPDPASGDLTFKVKVLAAAAEIGIVDNVATIDSDQTPEDQGEVPVGVLPPPEELTPPPTDTITPQTATSNPGFALMLILLGVAGLTLGIGFITPAPARVRRRDRLG